MEGIRKGTWTNGMLELAEIFIAPLSQSPSLLT